jgi:hypothetical protein
MTNERRYFFLATATLSIQTDSGTSLDIGMLQDVEIRDKIENVPLRACGSTLRQDVGLKSHTPTVKATIKALQFALLADMLTPTGTEWTSGTGALSGIESTSDVPKKFTIAGHCHSTGGKTLTVTVTNCVSSDLPLMVGKYGEWMEWSMEFEGDDITAVEQI